MSDDTNFGQYQIYRHDLAQYMKLDASALKALNLMPGPRDGSKNMSLYGLLNKCKTSIGTRLLAQWLKQPLMSLEEIEKRHMLVEAFVEDTELRQTMQEEHLKSIPDLYRLAKRFQRKLANLEDVVRAYQVVIRIPGIISTIEGVMDETYQGPLDAQYTNKLRVSERNLYPGSILVLPLYRGSVTVSVIYRSLWRQLWTWMLSITTNSRSSLSTMRDCGLLGLGSTS